MESRIDEIIGMIKKSAKNYSEYEVFTDWIGCMATAIQNASCLFEDESFKKREVEYHTMYEKHPGNLFPEMLGLLTEELENNVSDVLGEIYMRSGMGSKAAGQFFTPFHISYLTAQAAFAGTKYDGKKIVLDEPSIGGGGMVIAMAKVLKENGINYQKALKVTGHDIDLKAVRMSYVQLSLLGIDAVVKLENTLSVEKPALIYRTPRNMGVLL